MCHLQRADYAGVAAGRRCVASLFGGPCPASFEDVGGDGAAVLATLLAREGSVRHAPVLGLGLGLGLGLKLGLGLGGRVRVRVT